MYASVNNFLVLSSHTKLSVGNGVKGISLSVLGSLLPGPITLLYNAVASSILVPERASALALSIVPFFAKTLSTSIL